MPAPLGKTPTKKMPNIQVFGLDDSNATRGALRFFRERRIVVHFVDLHKKPIAPGELRRFVDRLGAGGAARHGEPRVSRWGTGLPLHRQRRHDRSDSWPTCASSGCRWSATATTFTAGKAEDTWKAWLARPR